MKNPSNIDRIFCVEIKNPDMMKVLPKDLRRIYFWEEEVANRFIHVTNTLAKEGVDFDFEGHVIYPVDMETMVTQMATCFGYTKEEIEEIRNSVMTEYNSRERTEESPKD